MNPCNVVIVDDHTLFAKALKTLIASFENVYVNYVAGNGEEFISYMKTATCTPNVVLLDVRMPRMDGIATMEWIKNHYPDINVLAITMEDDNETISKMIRSGCKGYLLKDAEPDVLRQAIKRASQGAFVYTDFVGEETFTATGVQIQTKNKIELTDKEEEFLKYVCGTDLSYKEIADALSLSKGAIDNRRETLFSKLGVNSRISAVLYAVEHNLVNF